MHYDINREASKTSALSSEKIDKHEYLAGEEILPTDQSRIIEQAKFAYFSFFLCISNVFSKGKYANVGKNKEKNKLKL